MPTQNGWFSSSTNSTRRRSGEIPEQISPAFSKRDRNALLNSQRWRCRLTDDGLAVCLVDLGAGCEHRVIRAEAHGATHVGDVALVVHEVDHRVRGVRVHLGRVGTGQAHHMAGELDRHHLEAEAQPEARQAGSRVRTPQRRSCPRYPASRTLPGSTMPSSSPRRPAASRPSTSSAWTQSSSTRAPWWNPACLRLSTTDR